MTVKKKKMNIYLKFSIKMLGFALIGGIFGFCSAYFGIDSWGNMIKRVSNIVREYLLGIQVIFLFASVLIGEPILHRFHALGKELEEAEDEESDLLEYKIEWYGAVGLITNIVGMVLAMLCLSTGYSMDYIEVLSARENNLFLVILLLFILNCIYTGFWQVRYVKSIQKIYPKQNADITSMKFQEQWLENCDEAEREMIYQASYKSYLWIQKMVSVLMAIAMCCHLLWDTGIMAVFMLGIIWITLTVTYCTACVKKKGSKLNI